MNKLITIIDYDMGNVGSIKNMIEHLGFNDVEISCDEDRILKSTHLILPGVGSFDEGMKNLEVRGLDKVLKKYALELKKPLFGICLGMQLLGNRSEEGTRKGLSLIDFETVKFRTSKELKIPHMGWNNTNIKINNHPLFKELENDNRFYFVHSYHAFTTNTNNTMLTTNYGYDFVSGVYSDNIYGVQFHPEKSHKFGMKLIQNFLEIHHEK